MTARSGTGEAASLSRSARSRSRAPVEPGTSASGPRPTLRVAAEVSLWLLTVMAAYGFGRLFDGWSFLAPVLLAATCSHLLAAALRRVRVPVGLAAVASLMALGLVLSWLFYRSTTQFGLPNGVTWDVFRADLADGVDRFRHDRAPVAALNGFVAGSAVAFWVAGFLADWAAFRLRASVEAVVPAGSLFVFASLLGADEARLPSTVLFFLAALTFLLVQRASRLQTGSTWVRGHAARGTRGQLRTGATLIVAAVVLAAATGPFLPRSGDGGLLDVRDLGGGRDTRSTRSPLVDIRQRLVDQREQVMFTVDSPEHAYWRLTALDEFDGRSWRASKPFQKVSGELPRTETRSGTFRSVDQHYEIAALDQIWLPAAYEARMITGTDGAVRWDATTSTLIADGETSDGLDYTVNSALTNLSAQQLRAAKGTVPAEIQQQYLRLPRAFPERVESLASDITAGAPTAYDAALALQEYFRRNFTYSTNVPGGQDINSIEDFLFSPARAGYCEQFAGTYAAMARSVGLAARVAVGFTSGDPVAGKPTTTVVRGRHAHAWPEVYLPGAGWVLFEPTPGRGAPNAPYTNTEEQQDSLSLPSASATSSTAVTPLNATSDSTPVPPPEVPTSPITEVGNGTGPSAGDTGVIAGGVLGLLLVVLAVLFAVLFGPAAWRPLRRQRRRRRCHNDADRVQVAWLEAVESLTRLGIRPDIGETAPELAERVRHRFGDGLPVAALAELITVARYSPDGTDARQAQQAAGLADAVTVGACERSTVTERWQADWQRLRRYGSREPEDPGRTRSGRRA